MIYRLNIFKPMRSKLLQIHQTRHQSTPLYLYIQNIELVCNCGLLCAGMEWEMYLTPNRIWNRWSITFNPMRSKLLQIPQARHQSTPLYLYIQNIKLVCSSGLLCAGLARENVLYTQPNINSMVDCLTFFNRMRSKLLQIGQIRHQSTPLYLNIKLVCNSGLYIYFVLD